MNLIPKGLWETFCLDPTEAEFGPLYDASRGLVYAICLRILKNEEDAADAFQSTYARLIAHARDFDRASEVEDFPALVRLYAVREADALRKRRNRRSKKEFAVEILPIKGDSRPLPAEIAAAHQIREKVEALVETLPDPYRVPLVLYYFQGMTHREIGAAMGKSAATIHYRIKKGERQLEPSMTKAGLREALRLMAPAAATLFFIMPPPSLEAATVWPAASAGAARFSGGRAGMSGLGQSLRFAVPAATLIGLILLLALGLHAGLQATGPTRVEASAASIVTIEAGEMNESTEESGLAAVDDALAGIITRD